MQPFVSTDVQNYPVLIRLIKNKLLAIPTLGLYRFWGKTHLRRQLWHSTKIGDDRLVYHGTAKELFIGFLIALVLLSVVFFVFNVGLQLFSLTNEAVAAISQLVTMLFLLLFWEFARYRLWRYRLSRTSFRTVRFFQEGSAIKYALMFLLYGFLTVITLGWLYPVMRAKLLSYRLNNMAFGSENFEYDGGVKALYAIYWPWILYGNLFLFIAPVIFYLVGDPEEMANMAQGVEPDPNVMFALIGFNLLAFVGHAIFFTIARVKEFNYLVGQTRVAGASFSSSLPVRSVFKVGIVTFLVNLAAIALLIFFSMTAATGASAFFGILAFVFFFVYVLFADILIFLYLFLPLFRLICGHLAVDNPDVFVQVAASSHDSPKYGEGLADALDVGAF